ncbi:alpha-L-fucosidase [Sphingomonas sp. Leaf357]|uniref:alpha-L-fucosidase n=1 Tax=Sphingomonas sp. Leaf357 TaxID=1736350 RepID=UPI0006F5FECE|nr:alpha-L-fucosidase [Sphingomonas sp. Leaf357]KQS02396.1 alpha-L-fucosidase [Sphingomonas sp. Leaf357]
MTLDLSRRALVAGTATLTVAGAVAGPALGRGAPDAGAPKPWGALPSKRQVAWHRRLMYGFVHFTVNTFTDKEWGYGDEDPKLFDPTGFDPDQIVAAAKAGNLDGLILTAKHHDGFCLWPSPGTEHSIKNSPYKHGKGDIVRELSDACRRGGIPFGVYLSPWDRNHADYGKPAYIDYFRAQLTDLCTNYGDLFEVWFDGANGGDGYYGGARERRKIDAVPYYNWPAMVALVHKLQPMACTFDPLGADLRWVANEDGYAGDPCWPTMPNKLYEDHAGHFGVRGGELWWPAETNVSIRPGWFYHPDEDAQVKSPAELTKMYDESVGRGTNFLLNIPPDTRGIIPEADVASLTAFGDGIRATFRTDLAQGAVARASAERGAKFSAARVLDGNPDTYWSAPDGVTTPSLTLDLPPGRTFDLIRIGEYLPLGVRVTRFAVDVDDGTGWREVANKECISAQRIIRLPAPVTARRVRLRILEAPVCPAISGIALFRSVAPKAVPHLRSQNPALVDRSAWRVVTASAPGAEAILDDDATTPWRCAPPGGLTLDLGRVERMSGFTLTPSRDFADNSGPPGRFVLESSLDGRSWQSVKEGEFANIANARQTNRIRFDAVVSARFLRFAFPLVANGKPMIAITEIGAFAAK